MPFDTIFLIFIFLPIGLVLYSITDDRYKGFVLIALSLFFYSFYNIGGSVRLLGYAMVVFFLSHILSKSGHSKWILATNLFLLTSYLIYYKYSTFFIDNLKIIFPHLRVDWQPKASPLGISFFTFTSISYMVDIYRTRSSGLKFLDFLNYLTFFPKIISGPIVRIKDFQFKQADATSISQGLSRFIIGLGKKTVFAYYFGLTVDQIWQQIPYGIDTATAWIGAICYTLQIYFDFSGYSDMAIGISKMFGYSFPENFNFPYISTSISEFWRRWHISLGTWFREYIYFPLGGSRKGNPYLNLFIVFLVTGIWHGANWTFIVWGLWHGFLRLSEKTVETTKVYKSIPKPVKWVVTMLAVIFGWVVFRSATIGEAITYIKFIFGRSSYSTGTVTFAWNYFLNRRLILLGITGILFSTLLGKFTFIYRLEEIEKNRPLIVSLAFTFILVSILTMSIMMIISSGNVPFIYFQF